MADTPDTPKARPDKSPHDGKIQPPEKPAEIGGRGGLDPVRYGDWEIGGKCVDF